MKLSIESFVLKSFLIVCFFFIAFPVAFETRQYVSIYGFTVFEIWFAFTFCVFLLKVNFNFFLEKRSLAYLFISIFFLFASVRGLVGVLEGNDFARLLRGLRFYLPMLFFFPISYIFRKKGYQEVEDFLFSSIDIFTIGYVVYSIVLLGVVSSPWFAEVLRIKHFYFRLSSNTIILSLILFAFQSFYSYRCQQSFARNFIRYLFLLAFSSTWLLSQSRFGSAMALFFMGLVSFLVLFKGKSILKLWPMIRDFSFILIFVIFSFSVLLFFIDDFSDFTLLWEKRIRVQSETGNALESFFEKSFGYREYRDRLIERIIERPFCGYGEGAGVGQTMSQDDGGYIDSAFFTMLFKNGLLGFIIFYGIFGCLFFEAGRSWLLFYNEPIWAIFLAFFVSIFFWSTSNIFLMYNFVMYPLYFLFSIFHILNRKAGLAKYY